MGENVWNGRLYSRLDSRQAIYMQNAETSSKRLSGALIIR
jgi:hypothetical protein